MTSRFARLAGVLLSFALLGAQPADVSRVLEPGKLPDDARLKPARTLNDKYHPWVPPATREAWEAQAKQVREQLLVSNGLWPLPPATPIHPVIHGKIERDDYTVEKVYFDSLPGHYVCGNLYRPKKIEGKVAGVLAPHGHWNNGRFYDAGEKVAQEQIDQGAEKFKSGAEFPLQARMVGLARMGCVVFHYDMIGYADSKLLVHREGFADVEAELRLQNWMGIQTWNSIRALDFITSLPEVDAARIGVTGASGGGTQTFMLCGVDPRPAAAFPAVMVSTAMQGGCVCENASYLRQGINNITISALFAPKPQAMSGADDWTIDIETKGLPELKQVYGLYGAADNVHAKCYPQFKHNYNQVAREMMYNWFNKHLKLNQPEPVLDREFTPVPVAELSVFDAQHPVPTDGRTALGVRDYLTQMAHDQFAALLPKDTAGLAEYRRVIGTAAAVMLDRGIPGADEVEEGKSTPVNKNGYVVNKMTVGRKGTGQQIPVVVLTPEKFSGSAVLWVDGRGKAALFDANGDPLPAVKSLLERGLGVVSADVFLTGEYLEAGKPAEIKVQNFGGYTWGYNRPVVSERVRDILTVLSVMKKNRTNTIHLVGTGDAGLWAILARAVAGDGVYRTIVDLQSFGFSQVKEQTHPQMLPGALKYGGLGGLAALAAPAELTLAGTRGVPPAEMQPLVDVYRVAGATLNVEPGELTPEKAAALLLK